MVEENMTTFPLFYTFKKFVSGAGFIADVYIRGRATAIAARSDEGGGIEWWFNGVEPGGLARVGPTLNESYYAFRDALEEILIEIAHQSKTFQEFEDHVHRFANQINEPEEKDWQEARAAVRRGELDSPGRMKRDEENTGTTAVFVNQVHEYNATPQTEPVITAENAIEYAA